VSSQKTLTLIILEKRHLANRPNSISAVSADDLYNISKSIKQDDKFVITCRTLIQVKQMKKRVVLCFPVTNEQVAELDACSDDIEVVNAGQAGIADEILNADIFVGHAKVPMPWQEVVRQGRLKWIQSSAAGLDHCLKPEVIESEIIVSSVSGLFANQVAEQTMALLFGIYRSALTFFRAYEKREFVRRPTMDFHGQTVGIIGFGGNGRRIAEVLAPWGNRILATDKYPWDKPEYVEKLVGADRLNEILPEIDCMILCVPLNDETQGMIQRDILTRMKPGSIIINVSRGPVINESDLIDALHSGHLAGAGLDVVEVEPLHPTSPLWTMDNVIISPHVGAQSKYRVPDTIRFTGQNIQRYLRGEEPLNVVDKNLGYPERKKPCV